MNHILVNFLIFSAVLGIGYSTVHMFDTTPPPAHTIRVQPFKFQAGNPAPDFEFIDLAGEKRGLTDYKGKIIVLNFWATWCAPCLEEFPRLLQAAKNNSRDVVLIALSSDMNEEPIKNFLKKINAGTLPRNVIIAHDPDQKITRDVFGTYRLPETLILDHDLLLRTKLIGAEWTLSALESEIENARKSAPSQDSAP